MWYSKHTLRLFDFFVATEKIELIIASTKEVLIPRFLKVLPYLAYQFLSDSTFTPSAYPQISLISFWYTQEFRIWNLLVTFVG